jgi:hypothetical protein
MVQEGVKITPYLFERKRDLPVSKYLYQLIYQQLPGLAASDSALSTSPADPALGRITPRPVASKSRRRQFFWSYAITCETIFSSGARRAPRLCSGGLVSVLARRYWRKERTSPFQRLKDQGRDPRRPLCEYSGHVWTYVDPARLQPILASSGPRATTADVYPASLVAPPRSRAPYPVKPVPWQDRREFAAAREPGR